jgi:5-methylcytosine-specific restriction endonuclease McrA
MDSCEICGYSQVNIQRDLPLDCHHISFQCNAIGNFCGDSNKKHITKNSIENLVALCKSCHQNVHAKKIIINGYIQTTNGKKLDWLQVT